MPDRLPHANCLAKSLNTTRANRWDLKIFKFIFIFSSITRTNPARSRRASSHFHPKAPAHWTMTSGAMTTGNRAVASGMVSIWISIFVFKDSLIFYFFISLKIYYFKKKILNFRCHPNCSKNATRRICQLFVIPRAWTDWWRRWHHREHPSLLVNAETRWASTRKRRQTQRTSFRLLWWGKIQIWKSKNT